MSSAHVSKWASAIQPLQPVGRPPLATPVAAPSVPKGTSFIRSTTPRPAFVAHASSVDADAHIRALKAESDQKFSDLEQKINALSGVMDATCNELKAQGQKSEALVMQVNNQQQNQAGLMASMSRVEDMLRMVTQTGAQASTTH